MRFIPAALFAIVAANVLSAGDVSRVSWDTVHGATPAKLGQQKNDLLALIRFGVNAMPEANVMKLTFLSGSALGLSSENALALHGLLDVRYQLIDADKTFSKVQSALPYCFKAEKPTTGLATVYVPDLVNAETSVILFLHGYGGSFTFYIHYLATAFPDHIIICPAYGISCAQIPSSYIQESLDATSKHLEMKLKRPILIGLSAGGYGGFREYVRRPASYGGYICLAAFPPKEVVPLCPRNGRIRLLAGGVEPFVKNGTLQRAELGIKQRTADYSSRLIPEQDHFFILSAEDETIEILKAWESELQSGR